MKAVNKQFDGYPGLDSLESKFKILSCVIATSKNLSTAFDHYFPDFDPSKTLSNFSICRNI